VYLSGAFISIKSLPVNAKLNNSNKGVLRLTNHEIPNNKAIRMNKAKIRPKVLALSCWSIGRRLHKIEMNMMLSIPKTISIKVNESKLIKPSIVKSDSINEN
jgi:hypothetical protein